MVHSAGNAFRNVSPTPGTGARSAVFEVTHDISRYAKAAQFQPGIRSGPALSAVASERDSPGTWRDPRGVAVKFYTSEGSYDMVGNNTPVFFVKDR